MHSKIVDTCSFYFKSSLKVVLAETHEHRRFRYRDTYQETI